MIPLLLDLGSLSLGFPNMILSMLVPLKCTCIPLALHNFLNFSLLPGMKGTTRVMFLLFGLLSWLLLLLFWELLLAGLLLKNLWCH